MDSQHRTSWQSAELTIIRPTRKRYLMLFMFFVLVAVNSFQYIAFASITNVIAKFYQVDNIVVNWTTVSYMVTFLFLTMPVCWLNRQIGMRNSVLISCAGTTIGLIIKCFSCQPDRFYVGFAGHLVIGLLEPFYHNAYTEIAHVWFPDDEVALATSVSVMAYTVGLALGFIIPVSLVGDNIEDTTSIQIGLFRLFAGTALVMGANTLLVVFFFQDQPEHPPGVARYKQMVEERRSSIASFGSIKTKPGVANSMRVFIEEVREMFNNRNFKLMTISYGISIGTDDAICTVLNQIIAGSDTELTYDVSVVGRAGLIMIGMSLIGSILIGPLLDRYRAFKTLAALNYLFTLLGMIVFTGCLRSNEPSIIYVTIGAVGLFMTAYECCGLEFAAELTYPKSEQISSTLLNFSAQIFGILITLTGSIVVDSHGSIAGCCFLSSVYGIGLLTTIMTKADYRRQKALMNDEPPEKLYN